VLLAALAIGLVGGVLLGASTGLISRLPILAMVPVINGTGGNLGCILGARLSSALHLGSLRPKLRKQPVLVENLSIAVLQAVLVFAAVGLIFSCLQTLAGVPRSQTVLLGISFFLAGLILSIVVMLITVGIAFASYKGGLDPDNIVIPVMTSVVDVMGIICLLLSIKIVGV
jgi:mgtE-like transporter